MAKKFLATLFIFISMMLLGTTTSFAQGSDIPGGGFSNEPWKPSTDSTEFSNYRAAIEDDNCMTPSLECLVHQVFRFSALEFVNSTMYPTIEPAIGGDNVQQLPYDSYNPILVGSRRNNNILYGAGKLIGSMYAYPAANTSTYIADVMNSAHITPQAYAQGLGFTSLNPILDLWKAFRNLAYMFFVVIFMIIGFMIMFRQRIGGQAAVTAQQAIPGVIISLILVTFSYAIAGLLIDFMYLIMYLIIGVFGETLPNGSQNLIDMNILQVSGVLFTGAAGNLEGNTDLISDLLGNLVASENLLSETASVVGGLTLTVVLAIAILIGTIKLFFELLKSYASVILGVVTSPIVLMMGAIPGKNPIVPWIKDIIGNLIPFPVVLLVLVLFFQFSETALDVSGGGFMPPFLLAQGSADAIANLMGLALILALPEIVKDSKKGLVKEGFGSMVFKAATESAKTGWKGGELIPGIAATNTSRIPILGSGKDFAATASTGVAAAAGGAFGVARSLSPRKIRNAPAVGWSASKRAARGAGDRTGSKLAKFLKDRREKKEKETK